MLLHPVVGGYIFQLTGCRWLLTATFTHRLATTKCCIMSISYGCTLLLKNVLAVKILSKDNFR